MINEKDCSYLSYCDISMFDASGAMKPDAYQRICVGVVERHLSVIELDVERLIERFGVSWVLLALTVDVIKHPKPGDTLKVKTWHTNRRGASYRRDLIIYNENDETVAKVATFSSLLDIHQRRICMDKAVHDVIKMPDGEELMPASSRIKLMLDDFEEKETLDVRPNWIDAVGHVNNFRYGEFTYDNLSEESRKKLRSLSRLEVYFTGELTLGDKVVIKASESENEAIVSGVRCSDEKTAFITKLYF